MLAPAGGVIYLAFSSGGFFPLATGIAGVVLAVALLARVVVAEQPFAGVGGRAGLALGTLAVYAAWVLASGIWSDAPARAVLELNRALLYLLGLALVVSFARSSERTRLFVLGVTGAIVAVCGAAVITRTLPDLWPIAGNIQNDRLSYPVSYWNTLGILAAVGVVLCVHVSSSAREWVSMRILSAAAVPMLAATILLTFSRGAMALGLVAVVVYLAVGRPRGGPGTVLAVVVPTVVALVAAYGADLLATENPTRPSAVAQGHDLALVVGLCMLGAAWLRALLLGPEKRIAARLSSLEVGRGPLVGLAAGLVLAVAVLALTTGLPDRLDRELQRFTRSGEVSQSGTLRERLTDPGNNGRFEFWDVALDQFANDPLKGAGAGTFSLAWASERSITTSVQDAHSLYLETLGELGVVGALLILAFVASLVVAGTRALRSGVRTTHAAILAVLGAWAIHAGIEWDWEMPVLTLPVLCLAGLALAQRPSATARPRAGFALRAAAGAAVVLIGSVAAITAISQQRLDTSVAALKAGDCGSAIDAALGSLAALDVRPEPYELLSYCDSRLGRHELAIRQARAAISREPANWNFWYTLALARAAAGQDPRPQARRAFQLNHLGALPREAVESFQTSRPSEWRRQAAEATLPLP